MSLAAKKVTIAAMLEDTRTGSPIHLFFLRDHPDTVIPDLPREEGNRLFLNFALSYSFAGGIGLDNAGLRARLTFVGEVQEVFIPFVAIGAVASDDCWIDYAIEIPESAVGGIMEEPSKKSRPSWLRVVKSEDEEGTT